MLQFLKSKTYSLRGDKTNNLSLMLTFPLTAYVFFASQNYTSPCIMQVNRSIHIIWFWNKQHRILKPELGALLTGWKTSALTGCTVCYLLRDHECDINNHIVIILLQIHACWTVSLFINCTELSETVYFTTCNRLNCSQKLQHNIVMQLTVIFIIDFSINRLIVQFMKEVKNNHNNPKVMSLCCFFQTNSPKPENIAFSSRKSTYFRAGTRTCLAFLFEKSTNQLIVADLDLGLIGNLLLWLEKINKHSDFESLNPPAQVGCLHRSLKP